MSVGASFSPVLEVVDDGAGACGAAEEVDVDVDANRKRQETRGGEEGGAALTGLSVGLP